MHVGGTTHRGTHNVGGPVAQEAELARAVADKAAVTRAMWQELRDKEADLGRALARGAPGVRAPLVPRGRRCTLQIPGGA
jgi:hypothetical protein